MQVSDLNNNLLNMVTGQSSLKEEGQGNNRFVDLLHLSEKAQPLAEKEPIEVSKPKEFTVQLSQAEVKKPDQNMDRSASPEKEQEVPSQENKTEQPEQNQPEQKKEAPQAKDAPEAKGKENVAISTESEPVVSDGTVEMTEEAVDVILQDNLSELLMPVVSGGEALAEENAEAVVIGEEVAVVNADENVAPVSENAVANDVTEDVLPSIQKPVVTNEKTTEQKTDLPVVQEDVQTKNSEPSVNKMADNTKAEASVDVEQADVIQLQEEKIAEVLPEDKKVEIKVSVKEDKVEAKSEKIISDSVFEVQKNEEKIEFAPVEEKLAVEAGDSKEIVKNEATDKTSVAPVVENKVVAQADAAVVQAAVINETEVAVQSPVAVAAIANDTQNNATVTETVTLRDNYNKGITREVAEQIKVNITQSAIKGVDKIEIQLKPADLGQVEIKLHIAKDGRVQAQIIASNAETLELLQKDTDLLKEAFNSAGYQAEDGSFSFSHRGGEEAESEREKLREFIGEVITQDVAEEMAANDYISADGVNIRV